MTQRGDTDWPRDLVDEGQSDAGRGDAREDDAGEDGGNAPRGTGDAELPDAAHPSPQGGAEVTELEDRWRRSVADLDNLRKRYQRELPRERAAERERVASAFLPVVDNIDRALEHADAEPGAITEGVRAIRDQAVAVLAHLGYPRQDEVGSPFDPGRHEVVAVVPTAEGAAPGVVVEVVRPGYGGPERSLRPAAVTVSGHPEN